MTVGPTVWPSSRVSTPCEVERIDQRASAGFDLGLVDRLLRRAGEQLAGGSTHWPRWARPELELGLLGEPDRRAGRRQRPRVLAVCAGRRASSQSSSSAASYTRRHRQLAGAADDRSSASTCCRTPCEPCARSAWRPHRRPCRCASARVRNEAPVSDSAPPTHAATSTTMAPPEAIRLRSGSPTSAPIQPPA